jgi:DNA-binding response OmpR family regulator
MANIVVVEDEPVLLGLISRTLLRDGHQVTGLGNPLAAIAGFTGGNMAVDLLLTDFHIDPINGLEFASRMFQAGYVGPVVFMSGQTAVSAIVGGTASNRFVVEKPFTALELREIVNKALARPLAPIGVC